MSSFKPSRSHLFESQTQNESLSTVRSWISFSFLVVVLLKNILDERGEVYFFLDNFKWKIGMDMNACDLITIYGKELE